MKNSQKSWVGTALLAALLFVISPAASLAQANGLTSAVINAKTGKFISGSNENQVMPIASVTKIMTANILSNLNINLNKKVTITKAQIDYVKAYVAEGDITSSIDLRVGDKVTLRDLWYAMLIASSNEAAIALVDNSGISRKEFVKRMNAKAKALGLKKTKFTEPTGIDPNNVSTAKETAIFTRNAYTLYNIRVVSAKPSYKFSEIKTGRKVNVVSRNTSLLAMNPLAMKVGYLTEAKNTCAVRLAKAGNDRVVAILHASNSASRNAEINRLMKK